ncbi:MAG: monovalent cation/H(+) antiporter subunit G [Anaerolineae bacterium]|nr:monovalent cation/H(+) antiporter subunit G [Thermoflexales bacterium]MDW8406630.1 monovalent cation/H(+) antiporter subunit G [Anaerolineae bacterium]
MEATLDPVLQVIALLAIVVGSFFSLIGVLGFVRLPDVYTRLHAAGKVSVFGAALLALAAVAVGSLGLGKALVLIALLVIAGPAVSHALASAAYRTGVPMTNAMRDDLARRRGRSLPFAQPSDPSSDLPV